MEEKGCIDKRANSVGVVDFAKLDHNTSDLDHMCLLNQAACKVALTFWAQGHCPGERAQGSEL